LPAILPNGIKNIPVKSRYDVGIHPKNMELSANVFPISGNAIFTEELMYATIKLTRILTHSAYRSVVFDLAGSIVLFSYKMV